LRFFATEDEYVEELVNDMLADPIVVYIQDEDRVIYGEQLENFILIDSKNNIYFGDEPNSFLLLKVK
ncbi:MAG: hypothetical protein IKT40_05875, partial [Bacilli bacterium]|nr:hypothetical protein [Bacilli bacterium]